MCERRPFASWNDLHAAADEVFDKMPADAWLKAFAAHPKIGDVNSMKIKLAGNKKWSADEQAGVNETTDKILERLHFGNQQYLEKFGYIFIVCATGKSAAEMLTILEGRLDHQPEDELSIAASEQRKITHLRLNKLNLP